MKAETLSRRDFLRHSGFVATGLATGGTIIFGQDYAWALSTSALDPHTAATLMVMARQLFPHDRLGERLRPPPLRVVHDDDAHAHWNRSRIHPTSTSMSRSTSGAFCSPKSGSK